MFFCCKKKYHECPFCFFHFETNDELEKHKHNCLFSESNDISNVLFENTEFIIKFPKHNPPPHK